MQGPLGEAASPDGAVLAQPPTAAGRGRALAVLPGIASSGHASQILPQALGSQVHRAGGSFVHCRLLDKRPLLQGTQGPLHRLLLLAAQEHSNQSWFSSCCRKLYFSANPDHQTLGFQTQWSSPTKAMFFSSWLLSASHSVGIRLDPVSALKA